MSRNTIIYMYTDYEYTTNYAQNMLNQQLTNHFDGAI